MAFQTVLNREFPYLPGRYQVDTKCTVAWSFLLETYNREHFLNINMSAPKRSGVSCSYKNCTARFNRGGEGVHFFRFLKNGDLCKLWLQACGREDLPSLEYQHYHKTRRVCSNHFEKKMYMGPSKSRLLPTAVPKQIESDTNIQEESGNNPEFQPPAKIRVVDIAAISGPSHQGNITSIGFDACSDASIDICRDTEAA
ncbi:uncharacterized protein LOC114882025 [Osmia bicornis bicornis]|uniref:uncharacterized protein LOC114882025 n=1 Tax=Osmia bicornis bicornis TaxID=1437191 RepID=UPI001EAE9868|nr:uncharacterized protein LOC114882025 [Osmia bicornis bicornis]